MRYIAFDTETHLIKPGLTAPKMVCLSAAERFTEGVSKRLEARDDGLRLIRMWLLNDHITLVGHNIWYDLGVCVANDNALLPLVFKKVGKGLVRDTQLQMQLIDVAEGQLKFHFDEDTGDMVRSQYHLSDLSLRLNKRWVKKADTWRLKYALLDNVPVNDWPEDARKYAIDDAEITLEVFEAQKRFINSADWTETDHGHYLPNVEEQHRAAWALHLMSMWGIRTDGKSVAELKEALLQEYAEQMAALRPTREQILAGTNLFNISPARVIRQGPRKGTAIPEEVTKHMQAIYARVQAAFDAKGEVCPLTEKGKVATDKKTLLATQDPELKQLAEVGATAKLLKTYVPVLEGGTRWPINARYNVLMETGRTSCAKPNLQNPPRAGGIRECFIPRPGNVFVFSDYDTLELRALAQVCLDILGRSTMAEALRRGEDLHLSLAAEMLGIVVEEAQQRLAAGDEQIEKYRQQAKPANFGFPGGMSAKSFKEYAEGYKIYLTLQQCEDIRDHWMAAWPEMEAYFAYISRLTDRSDQLRQVRSGRVRGGANYCAAANGFFQGLASDGAKEALWNVAVECYTVPSSPLYGCRPVLFLHDEIGLEVSYADPDRASKAADRLSEVMIESMERWIPDVPITCKPVMCRRWYKGAKPVRVDGRLVPSKPQKMGEKTKWVVDFEVSPVAKAA